MSINNFFPFLFLKTNNDVSLHRNTDVQPKHWGELFWHPRKFNTGDNSGLISQHGGYWRHSDGCHWRTAHQQHWRYLPDWQFNGKFWPFCDSHNTSLSSYSKWFRLLCIFVVRCLGLHYVFPSCLLSVTESMGFAKWMHNSPSTVAMQLLFILLWLAQGQENEEKLQSNRVQWMLSQIIYTLYV